MEADYRVLGERREVGVIAGYSAQIEFLGSTTVVLHYFPTALEAGR